MNGNKNKTVLCDWINCDEPATAMVTFSYPVFGGRSSDSNSSSKIFTHGLCPDHVIHVRLNYQIVIVAGLDGKEESESN